MSATTSRHMPQRLVEPAAAVLLTAGLFAGAHLGRVGLLVVVAASQLGVIAAFAATRPPNTRGVVAIAVLVAAAADSLAMRTLSLDPLAGVVGLSVLATIVVQLTRGVARARVTEAMAASLGLGLAVVAVATLLVLRGQSRGGTIIAVAALAAGVALLVAAVGIATPVVGGIAALAAGGVAALVTGGVAARVSEPWLTRPHGAMLGAAVGFAAVLGSRAVHVAGVTSAPARPVVALLAGPLVGLVAAAPVAYLLAGVARR